MNETPRNGLVYRTEVVARTNEAKTVLLSPGVGYFRPSVADGDVIQEGQPVGDLEMLGKLVRVLAPAGAPFRMKWSLGNRTRVAVGFDTSIGEMDRLSLGASDEATQREGQASSEGLFFAASMSGRFFAKSSPDAPAFVKVGDVIKAGDPIGLLEVMKTFNRVVYQATQGLPNPARVKKILPQDGDDVTRGQKLLELEAE